MPPRVVCLLSLQTMWTLRRRKYPQPGAPSRRGGYPRGMATWGAREPGCVVNVVLGWFLGFAAADFLIYSHSFFAPLFLWRA